MTANHDGPGSRNYLSAIQVRGGPHIGGLEGLASLSDPAKDPPQDAPELLQRIAEAAAVGEARRLVTDAALDQVFLTDHAIRQNQDPSQQERLLAEKRAAQAACRAAREAQEYAVGVLTDLYRERDARRRYAALEEEGKL